MPPAVRSVHQPAFRCGIGGGPAHPCFMFKRVSLIRRRPDVSPEAFSAHWAGPHALIAPFASRDLACAAMVSGAPNQAAPMRTGHAYHVREMRIV